MEDLHGLFQLFADRCYNRRKDLHHARWTSESSMIYPQAILTYRSDNVFDQSPDLQSMEQIRRVMRPTDVPDTGLLCDLLWSDPDKDITGWSENDRGVR